MCGCSPCAIALAKLEIERDGITRFSEESVINLAKKLGEARRRRGENDEPFCPSLTLCMAEQGFKLVRAPDKFGRRAGGQHGLPWTSLGQLLFCS